MAADDRHVVQQRGKQLRVSLRQNQAQVLTVSLIDGAGRRLVGAELDGRWLVLQFVSGDADKPSSRLVVHDLEGKRRPFAVGADMGVPTPGLPSAFDVDDGHLVYSSQDAGPTNCVVELAIGSMNTRAVHCTDEVSQGAGQPTRTEFGITFSEWTPGDPEGRGCAVLHVQMPDQPLNDPEEQIPARRDCAAWTGLVGDDFRVWSEPRPRMPDEADLYALTLADGEVLDLGQGDTASPRICGDDVLWLSTREGATVINRWWPGDEVEEIYVMPKGSMLISRLRCDGPLVTFHLSADGPDVVTLMGLDLS